VRSGYETTVLPALDDLVALLTSAKGGAVALTGAGMSTESGIPDYRGPDGTRRVTPMTYAEFVASSAARRRYWARSHFGWARFRQAAPNDGHRGLAALQGDGWVGPVITQNVDGLHQQAGSTEVVELHGTLGAVVCLTCHVRLTRRAVESLIDEGNPHFAVASDQIRPDGDFAVDAADVTRFVVPTCPSCGADTLKPDVVFFGESVPADRVARCFELVDGAEVLLVLGSSLRVMSGYRFVRRALSIGIPVAVVTRGAFRGVDEVTLAVDAALGVTLTGLARAIGAPVG
jgi:NAD-dependent SIR2 family protein deacetylase